MNQIPTVLGTVQANTTPALRQWSCKTGGNSRLRSNEEIQRNMDMLVNILKIA